MSTKVIYWSGTGNTEAMAEAIAKGANVEAIPVGSATASLIEEAEMVFLGCSSQGAEELDDSEFLPFLESVQSQFAGKKVALFGSYDWGNGEWMEDWESQMKDWGAAVVESPIIANLYPEDDVLEQLQAWGEKYKA